MIISPYKMLLSPSGRMGRKDFWIGTVVLFAVAFLFTIPFKDVGQSMALFFLYPVYLILFIHMTYCIYGKRLHDMGHSFWPLTGVLVLFFIISTIVLLDAGGAEYFTEYSKYERKAEIADEMKKAIDEPFQREYEQRQVISKWINYALLIAFTLWCGLSKTHPETNNYGPPAT